MKVAVLPPSLMITSIVGFVISAIYTASGQFDKWFAPLAANNPGIFENFGVSLGFACCLAFILMFIASMVSITPTDKELSV